MDAVARACDALEVDSHSRISHPRGVQNGPAFWRRCLKAIQDALRDPNHKTPVFSPESSDTESPTSAELSISNDVLLDEDVVDSASSRQQGLGAVAVLYLSSNEEANVDIDWVMKL